MKGKVLFVIALLSAVSVSFGAVGIGRATVHEDHPDQCFNAKNNSYHSPGESWPMGNDVCGIITCERSSSQLLVSYTSCGSAYVSPPCYLVEDLTKPYPDCCKQPVCPEQNSDEMFPISSEEEDNGVISVNNVESAPAASSVNDPSSSLRCCKEDNAMSHDDQNDLHSLEDYSDENKYEIIEPKELPPTFQFATFDDIGNDPEQRFNDIDAHDYQLV